MQDHLLQAFFSTAFWDAISSVVTLVALIFVLLVPYINQLRRLNRIEKLIQAEISHNYSIVRNMVSLETVFLPATRGNTPIKLDPVSRNESFQRRIDLEIWKQYRFDLATSRPGKFERYRYLNKHIESIVDLFGNSKYPPIAVARMQSEVAQSFVEGYERL